MYYPSNLPYMTTLNRRVALDRGTPPRRGNLVFLLTPSTDKSIELMSQHVNFYSNGYIPRYFYPPRYNLYVGKRKIIRNRIEVRNKLEPSIQKVEGVRPYPRKLLIDSAESRSCYYDLSFYMQVFNDYSTRMSAPIKIANFWKIFKPIFEDKYGNLNHKCVLVDASMYPLLASGPIKERIKNPLYLIYITLYRYFDLVKGLDIDFLIFANERVLKVNFKECDEKSFMRYLPMLKKLYRAATIDPIDDRELKEAEKEAEKEEKEDKSETVIDSDEEATDTAREKEVVHTVERVATTGKVEVEKVTPSQKLIETAMVMADRKAAKTVMASLASVATAKGEGKEFNKEVAKARIKVKNITIGDGLDEEEENKELDDEEELMKEVEAESKGDNAEKTEEEEAAELAVIYNNLTKDTTPKSQRSSARDELLREEQGKIQVKNMTLDDLAKINPKEREIPVTDVSKTTYSANPNVQQVKFNNFNKTYVDECMTKDIVDVFENLNNKSIKMYIRDIEVEDTSTVTDLKETWTVYLEDEQRTRHTIKVDIPKFYDKNFLWLGGNRKTIKNQLFFLPLVKISENTVMVVSNYNKMTMTRIGGKSLTDTTLIAKILDKSEEYSSYFEKGSSVSDNKSYITTLEYDDFARSYTKFSNNGVIIYFNQKVAEEYVKSHKIDIPAKHMFIGVEHKKPIFVDIDKQTTDDGRKISDIILDAMPEDANKKFQASQMKIPKSLMHTRITTMKQEVPLSVLICIWEGLSSLLEKGKIKYRLVQELKKSDLSRDESFIKFKDCFLVYKRDVPSELLMNGLRVLDTENHTLYDMNSISAYMPYVQKRYGKISILNALNNVYEFTIGPIEKELLLDLKLPTDLVELLIYGNNLLADSQYTNELNLTQQRVRSAEIIPAILYDCIAKAYVPYKNSSGKKKLSIPQDAVIKKLLALETVEDTSSLNPFLELETTHNVSTKGWRGVNLEHSYTVPKRCYDDTMRGVVGVSNSPDAQVGINRTLSMEPNIESVRGYIKTTDNLDELKDVNLFSPAELLIPLGATRDDPIRIGHSVKQSRASVPVANASPVLMSNGSDEACAHYLSSDYVVEADQDGTVIEYDEKAQLMVVEYKDGSHRAVNLGKNIVKNGGGGFEISNHLITDLKVGDKFKAHEMLAWHDKFFKKIPGQGTRMCVGALAKVALYSLYNTYEDGTFICESLSDKCSTEMVFRVKCVLGKNANVFNMVKVGDHISVGQPLIEFDESFEEGDINQLLAALGDDEELKEAVIVNSKNAKKSDKSGEIEEIKIYSASELDALSPSLQKIVGDYYKKIERKNKLLNKYDKTPGIVKCGVMLTESAETTKPNRYGVIRGEKVNDGVLIEFYIKHSEPLEIGSKLANFSPLKNETGEIIPAGYEPKSEFRPEENVETVISPSSILARMVGSVYPTIFGNKIIIELKRKLYDMYVGKGDYATKRKQMLKVIYGVFNTMDPTGSNTKKYKDMFEPMSENQWKAFWKEFFENKDHYLIFEMVDYEVNITVEQLEDAAKVLGIPLYEYVTFPHLTMGIGDEAPIVTPHRVPVGYIHIKRPQQTVMKKNGMSTGTSRRAGITNQVTGEDKNGRESDLENCMLVSMGMEKTLKELNGPRADDSTAEKEMLQAIATKGYVNLSELTDDVSNKATLNAVDTYFLGMGLKTDLVTKGLKLPKNIDAE